MSLPPILSRRHTRISQLQTGGPDPAQYELGSDLTLSPYAHGLMGDWTFDDAKGGLGSVTTDSSGLGNNGTLSDASSTGSGPTYLSSGCIERGCLSFDRNDDYVALPAIVFHSGSFTLVAWVKTPTGQPNARQRVISPWEVDAGGTLRYPCYMISITPGWCGSGGNSFSSNIWNFIAVTFDGLNLSQYINGNLVYESPAATATSSRTRTTLAGLRKVQDFISVATWTISVFTIASFPPPPYQRYIGIHRKRRAPCLEQVSSMTF